mgnify:CR=1 FL=1
MSEGKFTCMMFTIVQTLCDSIKNYFNISYEEAMNLLYHSSEEKDITGCVLIFPIASYETSSLG